MIIKITYNDLEKATPCICWHGVALQSGIPKIVDAPQGEVNKAKANRFFTVESVDSKNERIVKKHAISSKSV